MGWIIFAVIVVSRKNVCVTVIEVILVTSSIYHIDLEMLHIYLLMRAFNPSSTTKSKGVKMKSNRLVTGGNLLVMLCFLFVPRVNSQTWAPQITGVPSNFSAVNFLDNQVGFLSGSSGVIFKTIDAGANWVLQSSGTGADLNDGFFLSATTGWVVGQNGLIMKTVDGGNTWNTQASGTTAALKFVFFKDAQHGWAGGENGTIARTTNGGTIWHLQPSPTNATITSGFFPTLLENYLTCDNGVMLRSVDGGVNWQPQFMNYPYNLRSVFFLSSAMGWAVGANGLLKKTHDGGTVWYIHDVGTTQQLNAVFFVNADTGWIAGDGGLIKMSTNGGQSWFTQASGTTNNLRSLYFCNSHHGYAAGDNNTILEYSLIHAVPVQLANFTAAVVANSTVRLNWTTISEINNYGFEVERAPEVPQGFVTLPGSFIPGHGTTNEPRHYTYTDNAAPNGRLYYRLKQMDLDGTVHYTDPVSVDVLTGVGEGSHPVAYVLKQNYPNPFNPSTTIEFEIPASGFVTLNLYDILGREVSSLAGEYMSAGRYAKNFSAAGLASGVYWYKLTAGSFSETKKLILSK